MDLKLKNRSIEIDLPEEFESLALIIGDDEKTLKVLQQFQGESLYFPSRITRIIERENILSDYRDLKRLPNIPQKRKIETLANRYGKSYRWIYEIVLRGVAS